MTNSSPDAWNDINKNRRAVNSHQLNSVSKRSAWDGIAPYTVNRVCEGKSLLFPSPTGAKRLEKAASYASVAFFSLLSVFFFPSAAESCPLSLTLSPVLDSVSAFWKNFSSIIRSALFSVLLLRPTKDNPGWYRPMYTVGLLYSKIPTVICTGSFVCCILYIDGRHLQRRRNLFLHRYVVVVVVDVMGTCMMLGFLFPVHYTVNVHPETRPCMREENVYTVYMKM